MARSDHTRGLRDEANVGPDPRGARELKRLADLRYDVSEGDPDIRGWAVWASTGRELGVVDDLLVDVEAGEVVMIDVDLKRDDRHGYAPLRAAWIDHATRRVVLDARAVEGAMGDDFLPTLPRQGALTDADVDRFDEGYARAWGDRGTERDHDWRMRHGDDELRFGRRRPAAGGLAAGAAGAAGAAAAGAGGLGRHPDDVRHPDARPLGARADEPWDGPRTVDDRPLGRDRLDEPRRLLDPDGRVSPEHRARLDESRRIDATLGGLEAERRAAAADDARGTGERRLARVDDASRLDDERSLDPRELDARVRLDEGATVDDHTPVAGVRYEGTHAPHDYGRPDERYGEEYGSGRIGFDRVVTRRPWHDDDERATPTAMPPAAAAPPAGERAREAAYDTRDAAHDATRDVTRDAVPGDPRDRDRDGHVSLGERLREGLDRLRGNDRGDEARRVRYRAYDDRYDPGAPGR